MEKNNLSKFEESLIIALGVVEGQTAKLVDGEKNIWESNVFVKDQISIMSIFKNGIIKYKEVYNHDLGESKEFFY